MKSLVGMLLLASVAFAAVQPLQPPSKNPPKPGEKPKDDPKAKPDAKPKPKKIKDPLTIKVVTTTGQGNKYAGTDTARVYILLNADEKQKHRLTHKNKPFQRGAKDSFELKNIDFDPSKIESVRLLNDSADMWKCETISFQFFRAGKESKVHRHSPAQYLSKAEERKKLHAKPFVDLKMKVQMAEPKPSHADDANDGG
jgi:hypothetical protein